MSKLDLTDSNRIVCKKCEIGEFSNETTSISVNDFDILITLKNGQNKLFKQENLNHINSNDFYLIDKDSSFNSFNQAALHSGSRKLFAALNQQEEISVYRYVMNYSYDYKKRLRAFILAKEEIKRNKSGNTYR